MTTPTGLRVREHSRIEQAAEQPGIEARQANESVGLWRLAVAKRQLVPAATERQILTALAIGNGRIDCRHRSSIEQEFGRSARLEDDSHRRPVVGDELAAPFHREWLRECRR